MAAIVSLVFMVLPAANAAPLPAAFELRISEDANLTVDPSKQKNIGLASAGVQHELFVGRDTPFMQLMNTSPDGGVEITRMSITIGDLMNNQQHFDWVRFFDFSPGITWQVVMPDAVPGNVRSDAIDILFTGFTAGKLVRFQTDIDNDQGAVDALTDYRATLFDLGGSNPLDNAKVNVSFSAPGFLPGVAVTQLTDFAPTGPTNLGFRPIALCGPESVTAFMHGGAVELIPEPGTIALLACGLLVSAAIARRRLA
ncbi:MAG: PEP-CTERM sorting domain-containing protein [Pirellulales bacterium]